MIQMFDTRRKNSYLKLKYDPTMVTTLMRMSADERKMLYHIAKGCVCENENALKAFEAIFPSVEKSKKNFMHLQNICTDDFTTQELSHISFMGVQQVLAAFPGTTQEVLSKLSSQTTSIVAALRLQQHMTQVQLAELTGINPRQIQKIESLEIKLQNINAENIVALAKALNTTAETLLDSQNALQQKGCQK